MNYLLRALGYEHADEVERIVDGTWRVSRSIAPEVLYCLAGVGVLLALLNFLPQLTMRLSLRMQSFVLRLCMVALLIGVVAGLEWHMRLELQKKQQWTVLVDDSASMGTQDVNGASRFSAAVQDLAKIREAANGRVDLSVQTLSGNPLDESKPGVGPSLFREAIARAALSRVRPDRLVILSDGRDSEGRDLQRIGDDLQNREIRLTAKLYGSNTPPVDTSITAEPERSVLRLGEELTIRGAINGKAADSEQTVIFKEDGKDVRPITVPPEAKGRFEIRHQPKKKGLHSYTLELPSKDAVAQNDSVVFTVNVVEEKINVLLVEGFPRNEFKLIKGVLEVDPLVNLVSVCHIPGGGVYVQGEALHRNPEQGLISSQAELFKYDVVILQDVARSYFRAGGDTGESLLRNIVDFVIKRGGGLVVLGGQDVYRAGGYEDSALTEILPFDLSNKLSGDAQFEGLFYVGIPKPAYDHPLLRLLPDAEENRQRLNGLRQLDGSNNVGRFKPLATPLMTRTAKLKGKADSEAVEKEVPILAYMAVGDGKVLAAAVDTLWRWQLQPEFEEPPLTMLLANAVRYLAPAPGKKPGAPNVSLSDGTPQVGQDLILSTELRDNNFDPIQGADLLVTVTRPDGGSYRIYPRDLPDEPGFYAYRVALDQPRQYKVEAQFGKLDSTREFLAGAAAGEFADLSVDREGIDKLVQASGGESTGVPIEQWLQAVDMQGARQSAVRDLEVWNSPLVLILFLLLVSADCYLRKRQGLA